MWNAIKKFFLDSPPEKPSCYGSYPFRSGQEAAERDCLNCFHANGCYEVSPCFSQSVSDNQNEVLKDVTINLLAAISLLERYHHDMARTKRHALFGTMIADYKKAAQRGRSMVRW